MWKRPQVNAFSPFFLVILFGLQSAVGQQGLPLANFLIRPSSGISGFSNLHRSNTNNAKQLIPTGNTSGIDLEVSLPLTSTLLPTLVVDLTPDTSNTTDNARNVPVGDLFPDFLPMDNATSVEISGPTNATLEEDLAEGSGDGEILDIRPTTFPSEIELAVVPSSSPLTTQVPLDTTTSPNSMATQSFITSDHSTFLASTRARLGFYQVRETSQQGTLDTTTAQPPTMPMELDTAATDLSFATILHRLNETKIVVPSSEHHFLSQGTHEEPRPKNKAELDPNAVVPVDDTVTMVSLNHTTLPEVSESTPYPSIPLDGTIGPQADTTSHSSAPAEVVLTFFHNNSNPVVSETGTLLVAEILPAATPYPWVKEDGSSTHQPDPESSTITIPGIRSETTLNPWISGEGSITSNELSSTRRIPSRDGRMLESDTDFRTPAPSTTTSTTQLPRINKKSTLSSSKPHPGHIQSTMKTVTISNPARRTFKSTAIPTVTSTPDMVLENTTAWHFALLPEQRNPEPQGLAEEKEGHEGWTPFTISHANLPKFLFSTLIPSETEQSTTSMTTAIEAGSTIPPIHGTMVPKKVQITHGHPVTASTQATDSMEWPVLTGTVVPLLNGRNMTSTTLGVTAATMEPSTVTFPLNGTTSTPYPRPMLFWSDKPEGSEETRKLFADDTDGLQLLDPAIVANEQQDNGINSLSKQNISRDAMDNLITVVMRYVGQQDFIFNDTDKKTLAELIFWPIIHQSNHTKSKLPSSRLVGRRDVADSTSDTVPWPILRFMANTPKFIDDVWLIVAYVTYKDKNSTVMPRARLLTLCHDAELKFMTKMNMQLIRVYPGLPALPFNTTDLRHPTTTDYHPLFERFSSLFIPLIVLAAICAFVAIITVVCLLKKSQRNEVENKEKILRPLGVLGEENPLSDETIKHGERSRPTSSNATMPVGTSAKEMYETEGWVVPMDPAGAGYAIPQKRAKSEEEDTKL